MKLNKLPDFKTTFLAISVAFSPVLNAKTEENNQKVKDLIPNILELKPENKIDFSECKTLKKYSIFDGVENMLSSIFSGEEKQEKLDLANGIGDIYSQIVQSYQKKINESADANEKIFFRQKIKSYQFSEINRKIIISEIKTLKILEENLSNLGILSEKNSNKILGKILPEIEELNNIAGKFINSVQNLCNSDISEINPQHSFFEKETKEKMLNLSGNLFDIRSDLLNKSLKNLMDNFGEDSNFDEKLEFLNIEFSNFYKEYLDYLYSEISSILILKNIHYGDDIKPFKNEIEIKQNHIDKITKGLFLSLEKTAQLSQNIPKLLNKETFNLNFKKIFDEFYVKQLNEVEVFGINFSEELQDLGLIEINSLNKIMGDFKGEKGADFDKFKELLSILQTEDFKILLENPEKNKEKLEEIGENLKKQFEIISLNYEELFENLTNEIGERKDLYDFFNTIQDNLIYIFILICSIGYGTTKIPGFLIKKIFKKKTKK